MNEPAPNEPRIAVIGMAGRFPGARNLSEFWRNLRDGVESISFLTDDQLLAAGASQPDLQNPNYVRAAAILEDVDRFDAAFFGLSPKDAAIMDPQHRHFLECAWEALENAGWCPDEFLGRIGVYAGSGMNSYLINNLLTNRELVASTGIFLLKQTGNDKDVLATRVSYQLGLTGPSLAVQTACSTSLVAIHLACQSLLNHECDMALAGGVTIEIPHGLGYFYREGEILSRDGHCRAFDADSDGTIFGGGLGIVVLRRLEDALRDGDIIHAVILGTAINNDGARKVGYLAPSVAGQAEVIVETLAVAGVDASSISHIETHGTGTRVGDPIEINSLTRAFRENTDRVGFCAIGSLKTNIGHLDAAAGVAGFIKTVLSLQHRQLPPSLNFSRPNPLIDFASSPFFVNAQLREWETGAEPRRAGVTSLGIGGTNAHAILEEAPPANPSGNSRPWQLLTLSAKTPSALDAMARNLADHLADNPENLADVAFTLQRGRKAFPLRCAVVCKDVADAVDALRRRDQLRVISNSAPDRERPVMFLFSGQGAQYAGMGRQLYESEREFRLVVDFCADFLKPVLELDLRTILLPSQAFAQEAAQLLNQIRLTQPALFVIEYALARLWRAWGIEPKAMIGHSMGEFAAACVADVFPLESALRIVAERARLMQSVAPGAMSAVALTEAEIVPLLTGQLSIATVNAADQCVVAGPEEAVSALEGRLAEKGASCHRLQIPRASHSAMMDSILEPFTEFLAQFEFASPRIPYVSSATGKWISDAEATDPRYWARQLRQTVRFADGLRELLKEPEAALIEVGPGNTLCALTAQHPDIKPTHEVISSMRSRRDEASDVEILLHALGQLWTAGRSVDWRGFHAHESRRRVQLPTYPFERQRFWIEPGRPLDFIKPSHNGRQAELTHSGMFFLPLWERADLAPQRTSEQAGPWLIFEDPVGLGARVADHLRRRGERCIEITPGAALTRTGDDAYQIDPRNAGDYARLISELSARAMLPRTIVHLWSVVCAMPANAPLDDLPLQETMSFSSLLFLSQALAAADFDGQVQIGIVANGLHSVAGEAISHPERALLFGPCGTIPKELPNIHCCAIDVELPREAGTTDARAVEAQTEAAAQIVSELRARSIDSPVAYRKNRRWVRSFEPVRLAGARPSLALKDRGVYVITGGLGGIGLVLAESLGKSVRARLVLVGRHGLPARDAWDPWLDGHDPTDPIAMRIGKIRQIEAWGGEVLVIAADVTDPDGMKRMAAQAKARFGSINGIIHAAGVLADAPILEKDSASVASVLAPKVRGTLVLESAFAGEPLDFFALMSSVSSLVPPAGQVDYVAANAFLDAFAQSRAAEGNGLVTSIHWPRWRDVGMAANLDDRAQSRAAHPLLGRMVRADASGAEFSNSLSPERDWIVGDHRLKEGAGLFPGTGYIELARAAVAARDGGESVTIRDLQFIEPLIVQPGSRRPIRTVVQKAGGGYRFSVCTRATDMEQWIECAAGEASAGVEGSPPKRKLEEIRRRCRMRELVFDESGQNDTQGKHIYFGPRWKILKRMYLGRDEALTAVELPGEFSADLGSYGAHPSIVDMATGSAMFLISGYTSHDYLYIPVSYGNVAVHRALPARSYSHIRVKSGASVKSPIATFDVTILDEDGNVVVEIRDYSIRRLQNSSVLNAPPAQLNRNAAPAMAGATDCIAPVEGAAAFASIVNGLHHPEIVVFPSEFSGFYERSRPRPPADGWSGPTETTAADGSSDEVEATLARWWKELLGVESVSIRDNFFELGGQSLTGARLLAKVNKTYSVDLKLATLFQAPTIPKLARIIRKKEAVPSFSYVVPIRPEGSPPPLFLLHGVGGRILGFYELIKHLKPSQRVYGIEYVISDSAPAMLSLENLAARYVEEIRKVQPEGPYFLLGYSFGGILAFEMAQQLYTMGQVVGLLGMVDTRLMNGAERQDAPHGLIRAAKRRVQAVNFHARRVFRGPDRLRYIRDEASMKVGYWTDRVRELIYATLKAVGRPIPKFLENAYDVNWFAARRYQARPYPGCVTLFRGASGEGADDERYGYELGWKPLAGGGVEVHEITGTHRDIIREPNVQLLARKVTACLTLRYAQRPSQVRLAKPDQGVARGEAIFGDEPSAKGASVSSRQAVSPD